MYGKFSRNFPENKFVRMKCGGPVSYVVNPETIYRPSRPCCVRRLDFFWPPKREHRYQTWPCFKRRYIFQTIVVGIHVTFPGCKSSSEDGPKKSNLDLFSLFFKYVIAQNGFPTAAAFRENFNFFQIAPGRDMLRSIPSSIRPCTAWLHPCCSQYTLLGFCISDAGGESW